MLSVITNNSLQTKVQTGVLVPFFKDFIRQHDIKQETKNTYLKTFKAFISYIDSNNLQAIDKSALLRYKELLKATMSSYTVNLYLSVLDMFFDYLKNTGNIQVNPLYGIKRLKTPKNFNKDSLIADDVKKLLNAIDRETIVGKRDYALIFLMVTTGLRTKEIVSANSSDIRQNSGNYVLYIEGKGSDSKDDYVILHGSVLDAIRDYKQATNKQEGPLFESTSNRNQGKNLTTRSIRNIVNSRLLDIGINDDRISAHSLRHTAVTLSLLAGATLQETQAMARHVNINTTTIYAHNMDRAENSPENKIADYLYPK